MASPGTRSTSATSARSRWATTTTGKRLRRFVRGKTKQEVKDKLNDLHEEIKAGIDTPATYTVRQCVMDWLDSLELDPHTMATYRGQAEKWIYPKIGARKLAEFKATDADRFLRDVAKVLSKVIAGEDQEHARQVDPPSAEVRPHRQERRRARRPAAGTARAPVAGHDRGASQQGAPGRQRPADRLRQGREGQPGQVRGDPRSHRDWRAGVRHLDAPGRSRHRDRH